MTMADAPKPADGLAITRVFDAPRERIWREWTTPEAFADWYGGPEFEVPVESVLMDLRAGGGWKATMLAGPDRREIQWEGEYVEVVEPERLVFTLSGTSPARRHTSWDRRPHRPRRRPDRDAPRAARPDVGRAVRARRAGVVVLL
jgi:uncharacterized protein YndB with AHSA1/START domain